MVRPMEIFRPNDTMDKALVSACTIMFVLAAVLVGVALAGLTWLVR